MQPFLFPYISPTLIYNFVSVPAPDDSGDDTEPGEEQRPRQVPPTQRAGTKRRGKGSMRSPGNILVGIMYIYSWMTYDVQILKGMFVF